MPKSCAKVSPNQQIPESYPMTLLSLAILAFSILSFALKFSGTLDSGLLLGGATLLCAFTTFRSQGISHFLKIFVAIFGTEAIVFGLVHYAARLGFWPDWAKDYALPESLPLTVAIFGILVWIVSHIQVVRSVMHIADLHGRVSCACESGTSRLFAAHFLHQPRHVQCVSGL